MKTGIIFFLAVISFSVNLSAQKRNYIWCFGDSAGIDFNNLSNPITFQSGNDTRGSNCAIADTNGNLLFYACTSYKPLWQQGYVNVGAIFSKNHQLMQGGDSIRGSLIWNEVIIIPFPDNDSLFYVFFIKVTGPNPLYGLYYCVVNINANAGLGEVVAKNIMLQPFAQIDCLNAIKHGNGRDWWLFFRRWYPGPLTPNNDFYSYLITPSGITNYSVQSVGSMQTTGGGKLTFSKDGNTLIFSNLRQLIEKYDFNRCTGVISNPVSIQMENDSTFAFSYQSNALSPNGKALYISKNVLNDSTYLIQYNLDTTNIAASSNIIWTQAYPVNAAGQLKLAPDDNIYYACAYVSPTAGNYPYADSMYNAFNMNLGVINSPDSLGAACNFQPYSFYLGGKRTYWGLPNNPDYDMGAWVGSPCDTLGVGINELEVTNNAALFVTYIAAWQKLFVNAQNIKGNNCVLQISDINGRIVFSSEKKSAPPYFTQDVNCAAFANGMYIVSLRTEKEFLTKKFIIE